MLRFTIAQKTMELELLKQAFESFGDEDDASVIPQDSSSPCKQPTFKQQVPMTPPDDTTEETCMAASSSGYNNATAPETTPTTQDSSSFCKLPTTTTTPT